jgi:hypothetical protein
MAKHGFPYLSNYSKNELAGRLIDRLSQRQSAYSIANKLFLVMAVTPRLFCSRALTSALVTDDIIELSQII